MITISATSVGATHESRDLVEEACAAHLPASLQKLAAGRHASSELGDLDLGVISPL